MSLSRSAAPSPSLPHLRQDVAQLPRKDLWGAGHGLGQQPRVQPPGQRLAAHTGAGVRQHGVQRAVDVGADLWAGLGGQ